MISELRMLHWSRDFSKDETEVIVRRLPVSNILSIRRNENESYFEITSYSSQKGPD